MQHDKTESSRRMTIFIFALLLVGYFYNCAQRISGGVVLPHLAAKYGFSAALVGFLSSLFFYSYGFLQNVWGAVGDRVGPIKSCAAGFAIAGLGSAIMVVSHDALLIGVARLVTGIGLAAVFTGIYLYAALAFPPDQYPFWVGIILLMGNLGTVVAIGPLGALMDMVGADGLYVVLALCALLLSGLLWHLRKHAPMSAEPQDEATPNNDGGRLRDIIRGTASDIVLGFRLIRDNRALMVVVLLWITMSAGMQTLQALWAVSWMMVSSGIGVEDARFWATFISIGMAVGSPIGGLMTSRSKGDRRGILWTMSLISFSWLFYLAGAWMGLPGAAMGAIGFVVGAASSAGMVYCSSMAKAMVHISHAGLIIGTGNTLIYVSVIVSQWGSGLIINRFPGGVPGSYLNEGYLMGFAPIIAVVCLSTFSILSVKSFRSADE